MKLSDIMSGAGLSGYAEIALVIFLVVFIAIIIRTWAPSRQKEMDAAAMIPFHDENLKSDPKTNPKAHAKSSPRSKER